MPPENLQPQQETTIQANDFYLRYRSLETRFHLDESRWRSSKQLTLKCIARIDKFPSLTRERTHKIFIVSTDDLTNQKLVNWRNSGNYIIEVVMTIQYIHTHVPTDWLMVNGFFLLY